MGAPSTSNFGSADKGIVYPNALIHFPWGRHTRVNDNPTGWHYEVFGIGERKGALGDHHSALVVSRRSTCFERR